MLHIDLPSSINSLVCCRVSELDAQSSNSLTWQQANALKEDGRYR